MKRKGNLLVKSFLIYGITASISRSISLVLIPLYVRYFSASQYGIIDIVQTMIGILTAFGTFQLETSLQRYFYSFGKTLRIKMISTIIISVALLSLLLSISLFLSATWLSEVLFKTDSYNESLQLAAMIIPFYSISVLNFIILRYNENLKAFVFITISQVLITSCVTIYLVVFLKLGINGLFMGQFVGYFSTCILQYFFLKDQILFFWNMRVFKKMFSFAIPQFPARLGSLSNSYLNRFLMLSTLTTSSIGVYSVAMKFASTMDLINYAFTLAWIPFVYKKLKEENHKAIYREVYNQILPLVFLCIVLFSLFSKEIIRIFTVEEYFEASSLLPGFILYFGLFIIKSLVDLGPVISKRTVFNTYSYLLASLVNVVSIIFLQKHFGVKGVVYGLILTNTTLLFVSLFFSEKLYYIGFEKKRLLLMLVLTIGFILILMNFKIALSLRIIFGFLFLIIMLMLCKRIYLTQTSSQ